MSNSTPTSNRRKIIALLTLVRNIRDKYFMWAKPVWIVAAERYRSMLDPYKRLKFAVKKPFYRAKPTPPEQIHASWSGDPSSSFDVTWQTDMADPKAAIRVRKAGDAEWDVFDAETVPSPGHGFIHKAKARKLAPDTEYEYSVRSAFENEDGPMQFSTKTAPEPGPATFSFAFICDVGIKGRRDLLTDGVEPIMNYIEKDDPLFILAAGDYAYANRDFRFPDTPSAIDAFMRQMQPLITKYPCMFGYGNHEIFHHECFDDWSPRFSLPEGPQGNRFYSFDIGDAHFISIFCPGSRHCSGPDEEQLAWLDQDMSDARARGKKWLIAYQHDAMYAHGKTHPSKKIVREKLGPLFDKHNLDLHLSGHDQSYERTFPLTNVHDDPVIRSKDMTTYEAQKGVIYAKVSPSGKTAGPEYEQNPETARDFYFSYFTEPQQDFMAIRDCSSHHYAIVTVTAAGELNTRVYQVFGPTGERKLFDEFTIKQSESINQRVTNKSEELQVAE